LNEVADLTVEKWVPVNPGMIFMIFKSEQLSHWFGQHTKLEPEHLGEVYIDKGSNGIVSGKFIQFVPNSRIVFSWGWIGVPEHPPGSSVVEVTIVPSEEGSLVTLVHSNLPKHDVESHTRGWDEFVQKLHSVSVDLNAKGSTSNLGVNT
jgi:uncharacterized protein YndB with AHSA1/START domain